MSLSTTQYGYIVDPMVPFTDDKGKTIKNGFIRVFMAGTSTPVLTYRNYDGATNQEKIELDNSGRVKHNVIGSKGSLYKVVVYNILHSQENPLLTVDKIAVLGSSINASGATIVTGLDSVTVPEENFLKATVEGTGVELALNPTEVTSEVSTTADAVTAGPDYVVPLLDKTGTGDSKKISLANLFKFALDWISRLATTVTSFASGDFIAVSNPTDGTRKMSKDTLLTLTSQNALAGNMAQAFDPTRTSENPYKAGESVVYEGKTYTFKVNHYGAWDAADVYRNSVDAQLKDKADIRNLNAVQRAISNSNPYSVEPIELVGIQVAYTLVAVADQTTYCIPVKKDVPFKLVAIRNGNFIRRGYTRTLPQSGTAVENYSDQSYDINATITPVMDGYYVISMIAGSTISFSYDNDDSLGVKVATLETDVSDLKDASFDVANQSIAYTQLVRNHYIQSSIGNFPEFATPNIYDALVLSVSAGETYIISGSSQTGDAKIFAVYSTDDPSLFGSGTCVLGTTRNLYENTYSVEVTIPEGGKSLVASRYYSGVGVSFAKVTKTASLEIVKDVSRFRYSLNSNSLLLSSRSGEKELVINMALGGGNGLFDFRKFGKLNVGADLSDSNITYVYQGQTDWFGPFHVGAVANKDGDDTGSGEGYDASGFKITFTGGSHQYNNLQSGSTPTARLGSIEFRVNGEKITEGYGYASEIEIKWTAYVQAYNTKKADGSGREVLQENFTLRYNGVEFQAETEIIPLEDVSVRLWYGYQTAGIGDGLSVHWKYVNGTNRLPDQNKSGNATTKAVLCYGGNINTEMWLDESVDMGNRLYAYPSIDNSAFKSGNKAYFTIANDWSVDNRLLTGCSYYLFGKYRFELP